MKKHSDNLYETNYKLIHLNTIRAHELLRGRTI